ncbi:MAG TPA: PAS domain S-box protein [Thermomicrobiales bacterium]|jgi:PAS domain S-box-containing protein
MDFMENNDQRKSETGRLAALHALTLLDTPAEERFDRITRVAQRTFRVPIALINLIDAERLWCKSYQGLAVGEVPRDTSFCTYTIEQSGVLVVPDLTKDPRFAGNPVVTGRPHARFYAGHTLHSRDGYAYGTLCLIDMVPREFSTSEYELLADLAAWAEGELQNDSLNRALAEQRASEQRVRAIMDNVGDGIIVFDADGTIRSLNTGAERMFGPGSSASPGRSIWTLIAPAYPGELVIGLTRPSSAMPNDRRDGIQRNSGFRRERTCLRSDASTFPAELTVTTLATERGEAFIASVRDVSERRIVEEALRASEARNRAVLDALHEGVVLQATGGRIVAANPRAEAVLGMTADQLYGRSSLDPRWQAIREDGTPLAGEEHPAMVALSTGKPQIDTVMGIRRADDTLVWLVVTAQPLFNPGETRPHAVVTSFVDITARKAAEETQRRTLVQLEAQYRLAERARSETRAVIDAAGEGMILIAPDRRFLTVNRRFTDLFDIPPGEVIGRRFEEFAPLVERVFADPIAFHALIGGTASDTVRQFTTIVTQRWPEQRELSLFTTPVQSEGGGFLGRLYVFRDVTREREADRLKSDFISLVSHELRTPLTSIKGFVDLLLDGEAGAVGDEQREFLEIVSSNADRLVLLINDILDISRIESGRASLSRRSLDLARLIRGVAGSLRSQIEAKALTLTLDLPPDLPAVSGDTDRVQQILSNLLSNAYKYTPRGGTLAIEATRQGRTVRVAIRDSGIGLSPDEQSQVFTKFFRARNRLTQESGGTGLGLPITRSLVEMHGGEMTLSSVPGKGSTFSFTLPLAQEASRPRVAATPTYRGGTILVAEAEHDIAALLGRYLERAGYRVVTANDTPTALHLAGQAHPDLITVDDSLLDAGGKTLLHRLKGNDTTGAIPIVVISIHDDSERQRRLGADAILPKPVDEQALLASVRAILARNEPQSHHILVADGDTERRTILAGGLRWGGYTVTETSDAAGTLTATRREQPDLVILDDALPGGALQLLQGLRAEAATQEIAVTVLTGLGGEHAIDHAALEALGATLRDKVESPQMLTGALALEAPPGNDGQGEQR